MVFCTNALLSSLFKEVSEMLAMLLSIHSKFPKKSREVSGFLCILEESFSSSCGDHT